MSSSSAQLWFCASTVLRGFYQSQVVAVAETKEDAIEKGLTAFDAYIDERIEEIGLVNFDTFPQLDPRESITIDDDDDPEETAAARLRAREAFRAELEAKMKPIETGFLLQVHN